MARPPTYQSAEEKPVTVSARVPVELYAQAKACRTASHVAH